MNTTVQGLSIQLAKRAVAPAATPAAADTTPASVRALAENPKLQALVRRARVSDVQLDFSKATNNPAFVAEVAAEKLKARDVNLHDFLRFLGTLGVEVGWSGTFDGPFMPAPRRELGKVGFGKKPVATEVQPLAEAVLDLAAQTRQLALASKKLPLRDAALAEGQLAQKLIHTAIVLSELGPSAAPVYQAALQALANVGELHNRIFYAMTDRVEAVKTELGMGNEASWPLVTDDAGSAEILFRNTYREARRLTAEERTVKAGEALEKFKSKGGTEADIVELDRAMLDTLKSGELTEFVATASGAVRVSTHPEIKHSVLAGDEDARSAGGFRIWRNADGDIALVMVSAKSGHFRATEDSLEVMVDRLVELGLPRERVVTCAGDFSDPSVMLALDIWNFKAQNQGEMTKEQGNDFASVYEAFYADAKAQGAAFAAALRPAAEVKGLAA